MNYDYYIDALWTGQNLGASQCQKNLVPREYYENIVLYIDKVLMNNPDASIKELRDILINDAGIEKRLRDFCLIKKQAPGMLVSVRTNNYYHDFYAGYKEEVIKENGILKENLQDMNYDTIFDLASVTKLFTSIATLKLVELNLLNLNDSVTKYVPEFKNLNGITIYDLLTFKFLMTSKRIDEARSQKESEDILHRAYFKRLKIGQNTYNDFGAMILKYVIESVTQMKYYDFLQKYILLPLGMNDTIAKIDEDKVQRVVSNNYDVRIKENGEIITRDYIEKGVPSDDKARILGENQTDLTGHAGLFSTSLDMEKLTKGFVSSRVISYAYRDLMAKNQAGYLYNKDDGSLWATQFYGMLCYSKNPIKELSEVYHPLSGNSFASSGWAGTYYTIDPLNDISVFFGSNRSHNRVSINKQKEKILKGDNGEKYIILPDGRKIIDSSGYVYERDYVVKPAIELALKLKILEDIIGARDLQKEEVHTRVL